MAAAGDTKPNFATRSQLFSGLFLIATLNGFVGVAVREMESRLGGGRRSNLFGISAILWVALAAGLAILAEDDGAEPLRRGDVAVALSCCSPPCCRPRRRAASRAQPVRLVGPSLTAAPGSPLRRAAIIFLAITGALALGPALARRCSAGRCSISTPIFVSGLIGAGHEGNMIWSDDGATRLVVAPGCSSMQGMSLALSSGRRSTSISGCPSAGDRWLVPRRAGRDDRGQCAADRRDAALAGASRRDPSWLGFACRDVDDADPGRRHLPLRSAT